MKVARWGNSLAVRLPASLVEELRLKEGDQIEVVVRGDREVQVSPDEKRQEAIEEMRRLAVPLPPGYEFDREEANARRPFEPEDAAKTGTAAD